MITVPDEIRNIEGIRRLTDKDDEGERYGVSAEIAGDVIQLVIWINDDDPDRRAYGPRFMVQVIDESPDAVDTLIDFGPTDDVNEATGSFFLALHEFHARVHAARAWHRQEA